MDDKGQLVMVVEDDASMRQALQRLLAAGGYRERSFDSAEAFAAAGCAREAACLVLDVQLPGASGTQAYALLVRPRPPAIFITAHDNPALRRVIDLLGAALLPKPFHGDDFLRTVAAAIRRFQPER